MRCRMASLCEREKAMIMPGKKRLPFLVLFAIAWVHSRAVYNPVHKLETARLYGNIVGYAYWYVDVAVGTPPQRVSVILDTGSGLLAFPCSGCEHCGNEHHIDPLFNVKNSSTAEWVDCHTNQCHESGLSRCGPGNHCPYSQGYLEGSSIKGYFIEDFISLGDTFQHNPPVKAMLGCHSKETKLFYTQKANGIFGIQGRESVLHDYFHDVSHVNSKIFSICLASNGGRFTVGGVSNVTASKPIEWIALISNSYAVPLSKIEVDGDHIGPFGQTLVDSGTTFTYFASTHYKWLTKAIDDHCAKSGKCGKADKGCWSEADVTAFPVFHFRFKVDIVVDWHPREYLYTSGKTGRKCLGFKNDGNTRTTTLGATFMLYKEVIFDLLAKEIAFVPEECPEHKTRPKVSALEVPPWDAVVVPHATTTSTSFGTTGTQIASTTAAGATPGRTASTTASSTTVKSKSTPAVTHQNAVSSGTKPSATQRTVTMTTVSTTPYATHPTVDMVSSSTKSVGTHRTVARSSTVAASTTRAAATSLATALSTSSSEGNASVIQLDGEDSIEDEMPPDNVQWWRQGPQLSAAQIITPVLVLMFVTAVSATACVVKPKPVTLSSVEDPQSDDDTVGLQSKPPV